MRVRFWAAALAAAVAFGGAFAQDPPAAKPAPGGVVGIWEGPLKVGPIELRLAFHIKKNGGDKLTATMDSIDQGAKGIPCGEVGFADQTLTLDVLRIKGKLTGTLADDGQTVKGEWEQGGQKFPIDLKRVEKVSTLNRPQLPKKPYPYREEVVEFENPVGNFKLAGTLTLPKGDGPFPAVVLVSGSGPQDRDETLFGHKPFLVLADYLTKKGVAVLRYDDRGVAKSKGKADGATTADLATDAHAAVSFLKGRSEIDPKRIGIAGHSEGGIIAPMVAADHPADVGFIILLAGTGLPGNEILRTQVEAILKAAGEPADKIALTGRYQKALLDASVKGATTDERKATILAAGQAFAETLTEEQKKSLELDKLDEKAGEAAAARLADPWMHYFIGYDPRPALRKVKCPVLAVNGELDLQVVHGPNLAAIADALKEGGNGRVTTKLFPGLNHLFQPTKTGSISEYGQIEETFSPEALAYIADWVEKAAK